MANPDRERNIRLVLLGNVGAGKSATGNTLLGDALFTSKISPSLVTKVCEAQSVTRGGRQVTVVDTPGLTANMVTDTAKENMLRCLQLSAPGPHVFLLVICLGRFTQETQDTVERAVEVFGQKLYMFSIILFTFKDSLKNFTIEEFIISSGDRLQQLVQKCGSRYHAFNNENPGKEDEVGPLLMQIDKLVAANGGRWYTHVTNEMGEKHHLLGAEMNYEAMPIAQVRVQRRGKEEKIIKENIEPEEQLEKWEKWLWKQEEQLWIRNEHLREFEKHLRTSEELLYSSVGKDKEELLRQIETEKTERINERQETERILKDLRSENERIEAELKEVKRYCNQVEAQKNQIRQMNMRKQIIQREVDELEKKRLEGQTLEIKKNAEIIKLTEEKIKLLKELQEIEQQIKRNCEEIERQQKIIDSNQVISCGHDVSNKEEKQCTEFRCREQDLRIMQNINDQLEISHPSSSSDMKVCGTEWKLQEEMEKTTERMKTKLHLGYLDWSENLKQTEKGIESKISKNDGTAAWGYTIQKQVSVGTVSQKSFTKGENSHQDSKNDHPRSALKQLTDFLQSLCLESFYPNKLTTEAFLSVGTPKEKQSASSVAYRYLQNLLMLNYKARFNTGKNDGFPYVNISNEIPQLACTIEETSYEPENLDTFLSERADSFNSEKTEQIHPMDVQMAVFHCADSFLKQNIVNKLSNCQYALPLLVPSPTSTDIEFPLWTFRQIKKTWKSVDGSNITMPVCQMKTPMVFFCRLGSVSTSKSKLLNSVINPKHDTFFHRNSPGSRMTSLFKEGLVEIAWYCPTGNTDDQFHEVTALCNLHGDALDQRRQTDFLVEGATVTVVLMQNMKPNDKECEFLHMLHKSPKPLICLVSDQQKGYFNQGLNIRIGLKDRNHSELENDLIRAIRICLQKYNSSPSFSLEKSSELAKCRGFRIDEDSTHCQEGKARALEVLKRLESEDISKIKEKFLPCQGKLWHEWARKSKELHRLHEERGQARNSYLTEMNKIRHKQRASNLGFMKGFVNNLLSDRTMQTQYFIRWVQILLDDKFSGHVSQLSLKYNNKWLEVQMLRNTQRGTEELRIKQDDLEIVSGELDRVTLSLEHIFKEMGQIYEAWTTVPEEMGPDISDFPALAADLLISGHPLELMDGDAAHVPLTWIESVLEKVIERLGDQKVFVLSVLGLQSTGKSTMLNTMFGLQFAVSAGGCTKGAFMQLIRVKEEAKEELKFDYLLVLDTGGLRVIEQAGKSTITHDNELATFVIGLANMTLINIFGENLAEMEGLLQIAIQAIIRMDKVNLKPSCMLVHQNITDLTASGNMERRMHLQEALDEVIVSLSKVEEIDVKCLSEIIKLNIQTDVHYIAQLWEGNPPMAPPNPRYSENIEVVKHSILRAATTQNSLRLSELRARVRDLWTAVLNEDFVFSFKNNLEVAAYRKLEVICEKWTWMLRRNMTLAENKLHGEIENGSLSVGLISKALICKETGGTLSTIMKDMEKFFTEDKNNEVLSQWRKKTEQGIKDLQNELVKEAEKKIIQLTNLKNSCKMIDERNIQFEDKMLNKSKDMALRLKDKITEGHEIKREFDFMWEECFSDLKSTIIPTENVNIEQKVSVIMASSFETHTVNSSRQSGLYKKISNREQFSDYVMVKKDKQTLGLFPYKLIYKDPDLITELVQQTLRDIEENIQEMPVAKMGYSDTYTLEIINNVKKRVAEFESKRFRLKTEFSVDLSLYVCDIAVKEFTKLHKVFIESNNPLIYLENKKEELYSVFKKKCEEATATTVFAELVCNKLKLSLLQAVYDQTANEMVNEMRSNIPAFNGNRSNLEKHVLHDLAEAENFEQFVSYLKRPKEYFFNFIEKHFKKQMLEGENPRILQFLNNTLKLKYQHVATAIQKVTQDMKGGKRHVSEWLEKFSEELEDGLQYKDLVDDHSQENTNVHFLGKAMSKTLQSVYENLTTHFCHISSVRMDMFRERPQDILMKQLCGCWVQCPFCKAVCTNTVEAHDGDHTVAIHRPRGVSGWKYTSTCNLAIDVCTSLVATDQYFSETEKTFPFKNYRDAGERYSCWRILPDSTELPYWKWFVCRFQQDLERHFAGNFLGQGEIPEAWRNITKESAMKSLDWG